MSSNSKIGYCSPPKHTQFKPGKSGNPKGRPRQKDILSARCSYLLGELIVVQQQGKTQSMSPKEISLRQILKKALEKGDTKSIRYMIEQFEKYEVLEKLKQGL